MAYDEVLACRLREVFLSRRDIAEKKMFGGLAFLMGGHMCVGVLGETLMARVGPERHEACLARPFAREMDFTGRPMKGFVYVDPDGIASDQDLRDWVMIAENFVKTLPPKRS